MDIEGRQSHIHLGGAHEKDERQQTQVSVREIPGGMERGEGNSHWEASNNR